MLQVLPLVLALAAAQESEPAATPPVSDAEIRKAFAWFDTLGFPDLTHAKFVRVATGWGDEPSDGKPSEPHYLHGFLVSEQEGRFTAFFDHLRKWDFTRTGPDAPAHKQVGWEKADITQFVRARIDKLTALAKVPPDERDHWRRFGEVLSEPGELFVLARGAAAVGDEKSAFELYRFASTYDPEEVKPGSTLLEVVRGDIAHAEMWRAVRDMGDPNVTRSALRTAFLRITRLFPESGHAPRARETADLLERMIREDEEHARKPKRDIKDLTPDEQAGELVFQLRDQNGEQCSQPGSVDFFNDSRGEASPAAKLVALGYAAVPRLIEALDDPRFTRSVQFHRDFYFSHYALTVGDAAQAVLERIAARDFDPPADRDATKEERRAQTRKLARKWWAEFEKKGEKRMLMEAAERGEVGQARRLVEKYPQDALGPLRKGIEAAEGSWERDRLIDAVSKLKGDDATALLRDLMKKGSLISTRVAAASALLARGNPEAVPAMIGEWEKLNSDEELISFLAGCDRAEAVQALGRDLSKRSPGQRFAVITALGERRGNYSSASTNANGPIPGEARKHEPDPAMAGALEEVLVSALNDVAEREGMSGNWGGKSYADPRICDIAGHILWMRWPKKFEFDIEAPMKARDRQRVVLQNVWRKGRGLPLLPVPEARTAKALTAAELQPLVQRLLDAPAGGRRKGIAQEIMNLGSAALPALIEAAARHESGSPARQELDSLSRRLACRVEELDFVSEGAEPAEVVKKAIERLRGRELDAETIVDLVIQACGNLPKGIAGIRFVADRDGDLTGVRVRIRLVPVSEATGPNSGAWDYGIRVQAGGATLAGSSGVCALSYGLAEEHFKDFRKAAERALASPPSTPFLIRIVQYLDQ